MYRLPLVITHQRLPLSLLDILLRNQTEHEIQSRITERVLPNREPIQLIIDPDSVEGTVLVAAIALVTTSALRIEQQGIWEVTDLLEVELCVANFVADNEEVR